MELYICIHVYLGENMIIYINLLKCIQKKTMKMVKGLQRLSYEERD